MTEKILSRAIDLHIGSGIFYRPNYINIDLYEMSVVDLGAHAAFLPFKDGSIKSIEANHLIEHFSWVEVKYLLNEWFRVLEKGGRLILEVPDLVESAKELKKLKNSEFQFQVAKIQWIFGIQEEGMQHKSGFTFSLLRSFLHIIGFVDVTKEKPITHTYEKGIRISCKKPSLSEKLSETILRKFRTELAMLYFFGDIKFISLLERIIIVEVEPLLTNNIIELHKKTLLKVITKLCLCYPLLAIKFLSIPQLHPLLPKPYLENINRVVTILKTSEYHQKLFTLWKLRKKSPGNMKSEFVDFMR